VIIMMMEWDAEGKSGKRASLKTWKHEKDHVPGLHRVKDIHSVSEWKRLPPLT
jgi:hypothetical protein